MTSYEEEDSLESARIAQLHERLMQDSAYLFPSIDATGDDIAKSQTTRGADLKSSSHHSQSQLFQSQHGQQRIRHSSNTKLPRLKPAESAPDMAAATAGVDNEPLFQAHGSANKAKTFHSLPTDYDGDTQPMPSQVYKDYHKSVLHTMSVSKDLDSTDSLNGFTQYTTQPDGNLDENTSGHIDLMQGWGTSEGPTYHEISSDDESDGEGNEESQGLLSSVGRPNFPKTPATATRNRDYRGEPVSADSTKTPGSGLSAFGAFANHPTMSTSQMFQATQAASSPLQDALRSDPIFTRPSPNLRNTSSPVMNMESPSLTNQAGLGRVTSEPRDVYRSMKESQDQRRRRISAGDGAGIDGIHEVESQDQDEDVEQDSAEIMQARKRRHALLSNRAMRSWGTVTAPGRPASRANAVSPAYGTHVPRITFRRSNSRDREAIEPSDNAQSPDFDPLDEYDELAQEVRPSQREQQDLESEGSEEENDQDEHVLHGRISESPHPFHQYPAPLEDEVERPGAVAFAVADSQPGLQETQPPPFPVAPSSLSSVVPGSQYPMAAVRNGDNQSIANRAVESSSIPRPPLLTSQVEGARQSQQLPNSSPQQPTLSTQMDGASGEISTLYPPAERLSGDGELQANDDLKRDHEEHASSPLPALQIPSNLEKSAKQNWNTQSSHVPDTDPAEPEEPENSVPLSGGTTSTHNLPDVSEQPNTTSTYETAPVHQIIRGSEQRSLSQQRASQLVLESPRKAAGILRFSQITDPTPPGSLNDADINIDILTEEDRDYLDKIKSTAPEPMTKHLRVYGKKGKKSTLQAFHLASDTVKIHDPTVITPEALGQDDAVNEPSVAFEDTPAIPQDGNGITEGPRGQSESVNIPIQQPSAVEDAALKIFDAHPSSLEDAAPSPTPPSVKEREEAGARAAARYMLSRRYETPKSVRGKLTRPKSKTNAKGSNEQTPRAPPSRRNLREIAETPQANGMIPVVPESKAAQDEEMHESEGLDSNDIIEVAVPNPSGDMHLTSTEPPRVESSATIFPRRVFALFKGTSRAYYPATCLGVIDQKLHVRFDDGTTTKVDSWVVRRLELRRGDQLKVDLPGLRNKLYVVTGFKDQMDATLAETDTKTDAHGHAAVQLAVKERDSLAGAPSLSSAAHLTVPITNVYLTHTMFVKFNDRDFIMPGATSRTERNQTPVTETGIPTTPGSRSRRLNLPTAGSMTNPDFASTLISVGGVFAGMAFAVSYSTLEGPKNAGKNATKIAEKDRVISLIQQNGGLVVESGFNELFNSVELSFTTAAPSTPSKSKHRPSPAPTDDSAATSNIEPLALSSRAKSLGFVALIADTHSRRAKYVQALALSLPCLSGRWIIDSVAKGVPAPWPRYLLPAGESVYLSGAIRSRTLAPYDVCNAKLVDTFHNRDCLLKGGKVLLVAQNGKARWEARKAYTFLTIALGATDVRRVVGLDAAKKVLEQEDGDEWKWVYVDGKIEDAEKGLFGNGVNTGNKAAVAAAVTVAGRKRKRGAAGDDDGGVGGSGGSVIGGNGDKMFASNGSVKIVGDEFVVQSLILGALLEE